MADRRSPTDVFMSLLGKRLARAVLTEAERAGVVRSAAELVGLPGDLAKPAVAAACSTLKEGEASHLKELLALYPELQGESDKGKP